MEHYLDCSLILGVRRLAGEALCFLFVRCTLIIATKYLVYHSTSNPTVHINIARVCLFEISQKKMIHHQIIKS
jgi:hypothetical protein